MASRSDRLVAKNFLALGGGDALARVVAFGATAFLTRVLGAAGYGVVALAMAVTLYLAQLAHFGIDTLGIREIAEDRSKVEDLVPALLLFRVAYIAVVVVLVGGGALLFLPYPDGPILAAYCLTLFPHAVSSKWVHLGLESAVPVGLARISGEVLMLVIVLILVRGAGDLWAVPTAQVSGDFLAAVFLLVVLKRRGFSLPVRWSPNAVKPVFRRAWPIVGHSLLGLLIYNSDLIFLRIFKSSEEVGFYAAGYTLISFLINLGVSYGTSLLPTLTRMGRGTNEEQSLYQTAHAQVFAASLPVALGGALVSTALVTQVFGADFAPSGIALAILIWSVPVSLFRNVAVAGLVVRERQDQMLKTTIWSAALNIILNLLLIPDYGIAGAAYATLATEILRTTLALVYARAEGFRFTPPQRHWRSVLAGAVMVGVLYLVRPYGLWEGILVWPGIALGAVTYAVGLALVGGIKLGGGKPSLDV